MCTTSRHTPPRPACTTTFRFPFRRLSPAQAAGRGRRVGVVVRRRNSSDAASLPLKEFLHATVRGARRDATVYPNPSRRRRGAARRADESAAPARAVRHQDRRPAHIQCDAITVPRVGKSRDAAPRHALNPQTLRHTNERAPTRDAPHVGSSDMCCERSTLYTSASQKMSSPRYAASTSSAQITIAAIGSAAYWRHSLRR